MEKNEKRKEKMIQMKKKWKKDEKMKK